MPLLVAVCRPGSVVLGSMWKQFKITYCLYFTKMLTQLIRKREGQITRKERSYNGYGKRFFVLISILKHIRMGTGCRCKSADMIYEEKENVKYFLRRLFFISLTYKRQHTDNTALTSLRGCCTRT